MYTHCSLHLFFLHFIDWETNEYSSFSHNHIHKEKLVYITLHVTCGVGWFSMSHLNIRFWWQCVASDSSQRSRSCCHVGYFSKDPFLTCSDLPAIYLHTHPIEFLLCLQIHWDAFALYSMAPFLLSTQIVVSDDTTSLSPPFRLLSPLHRAFSFCVFHQKNESNMKLFL